MKFQHKNQRAFTLSEMMVTCVIFLLVIGGVLSAHVFGLKMSLISGIKVKGCAEGRTAIGMLLQDIRGGFKIEIGQGTRSSFTAVGNNTNQCGNAIKIHVSTNETDFACYYYASGNLCRVDGQNNNQILVRGITGQIYYTNQLNDKGQTTNFIPIFSEVNFNRNTVSTNDIKNPIRIFLRFTNSTPTIIAGTTNGFYDIDTLIAPRKL